MSMHPADIAYAALLEAGRPDLADLVAFHLEDDGITLYLEPRGLGR